MTHTTHHTHDTPHITHMTHHTHALYPAHTSQHAHTPHHFVTLREAVILATRQHPTRVPSLYETHKARDARVYGCAHIRRRPTTPDARNTLTPTPPLTPTPHAHPLCVTDGTSALYTVGYTHTDPHGRTCVTLRLTPRARVTYTAHRFTKQDALDTQITLLGIPTPGAQTQVTRDAFLRATLDAALPLYFVTPDT